MFPRERGGRSGGASGRELTSREESGVQDCVVWGGKRSWHFAKKSPSKVVIISIISVSVIFMKIIQG
jgi:hypothetical protein